MKTIINNLKMLYKLFFLTSIPFLLLLLISFISYNGLANQKDVVENILNNRFKIFQESTKINKNILDVHKNLYGMIAWHSSGYYDDKKIEDIGKEQLLKLEDSIKKITKLLKEKNLSKEETLYYNSALNNLKTYKEYAFRVIEVVTIDESVANMHLGNANDKFLLLNETFNKIEKLEDRLSSKSFSSSITNFKNTIQFLVIILLIVVLVIIILTTYISKIITKPLHKFVEIFKEISGGGDFTKKLDIDSKDEIGELSSQFNEFILYLSRIITTIKNLTHKTRSLSSDLSATSEESAATLEQIKATVDGIKEKVDILDKEIGISTSSAQDLKEFVFSVTNSISAQSSAINQSMASIEHISHSIQHLSDMSEQKLEIINVLEKLSESSEQEMKRTIEVIKEVTNSATLIKELIDVINGIAEQTNLLAMNAAIEAAHAGDYGRGFAVVADEIRKLAENTSKNSMEIAKSLKEVIKNIQISEKSTTKTGENFLNIVNGIKDVSEVILEVINSMKELSTESKHIMQSIDTIVNMTKSVKESSIEMDSKAENIKASMENLNLISLEAKNGMSEIVFSVNELFTSIQSVADAGIENVVNISELEEMVSKFRVDDTPLSPIYVEEYQQVKI